MALQKYTKEWLEELCASSYSLAEVLRKAGRAQGGGSQETLKKKIKEFNIDEMIKEGCLITAGDINNYNTMAIGWGMIGTIWRKKTFVAYVKPVRYTYQFMENNDYFTISFYDKKFIKEKYLLNRKCSL